MLVMLTAIHTANPISFTMNLPNKEIHRISKTSALMVMGTVTIPMGIGLISHAFKKDSEYRLNNMQNNETNKQTAYFSDYLKRNCLLGGVLIALGSGMMAYSGYLIESTL